VRVAAAALLLLAALLLPVAPEQFGPAAFLRLPVEALAGLVLLLVLPPRAGRAVAAAGGALVGLLAVLAALDLGFGSTLGRPFDPVVDAPLLGDAGRFVAASTGPAVAVALAVALALAALAVPVLAALAARCLAGAVARHRTGAARVLGVGAVAWTVCALAGTQLVAGLPVASAPAATLAARTAVGVPTTLREQREFAQQLAADPYAGAGDLLGALRGTDVVVAFVESYGRTALEHPEVTGVLDAGTGRLAAAGYGARSGFLTSPVSGGSSWLAHDTFLSGLHVDDPARHRALVESDRLTLPRAFRNAGWRTVAVMPGTTGAWPEAGFFGHERVLDHAALGYRGPDLGWATVPDQYTLAEFERTQRGGPPVFAEIALVSGHAPWPFTPPVLDWAAVGDGSVYAPMAPPASERDAVWAEGPGAVRAAYAGATAYTLETLVSYIEEFGDDELVLVLLGDHQPLPAVAGPDAGFDVPVSIVTRSPDVLDRVAAWGWSEGLRPAPDAPVWPMEAVRDRFLATFAASAPAGAG
jgi:hypothetical protein